MEKTKIAINGFGRIGRLAFQLLHERKDVEIVGINDLTDPSQLCYLLKYDSMQYPYSKKHTITYTNNSIIVDEKEYKISAIKNPVDLPWKELNIDIVLECTGRFATEQDAMQHIQAGAKHVLVNAPVKGVKNIVYGVNHKTLDGNELVVSGASCTTNALAPICEVMDRIYGIKIGMINTTHAYTNDQVVLDVAHPKGHKSRRGRTCANNIVPAETGAAEAVGKVLPQLKGKLTGMAMRVPVACGSIVDFTFVPNSKVQSIEEVNHIIRQNSNDTLGYTDEPLVSSDIIGITYGGMVDTLSTIVLTTEENQLVKIIAWYDNEMSYTSQYVRTAIYLACLTKENKN